MNNRVWAWRQDSEGNLLQVLARMPEGQRVDFSSESGLSPDTKNYEPFLVVYNRNYNDTLSRYEPATERWAPRFTIDNLIETFQPPYYSYTELPNHFIGNFSPGMTQVGENSFESNVPLNFFVDKKSLTGSYYNLKIGELGGLEVWPNFTDGYFVVNWPAITVRGQLKNLLDAGGMEAATAQRVQKLYDSLDDEDNNVLLMARLKR